MLAIEKLTEVENAVMAEFNCSLNDIITYLDTKQKKVLVFVLVKLLQYNKKEVAHKYSMSYLYVPAVISEIEDLFLLDLNFRQKLSKVIEVIKYKHN